MSSDIITELLNLGILERIKYTDSEIADAAGQDLPTVSVTKKFLLSLYEMKKPYTDNRYITDTVRDRRRSDIRRAIYLWLMDQGDKVPINLEGMANTVNRYVTNIINEYPILELMDLRRNVDSSLA